MHLIVEELVLMTQLRNEASGCVYAAPTLLAADADKKVAQAAQQVVFGSSVRRTVRRVLYTAITHRLAVVQCLEHRVAVAGVAKVFEPKKVLAFGEGRAERLLEPLRLAPGNAHDVPEGE